MFTFVFQHDPREYLNLSSHICREVEVSFSVVNQFGSTNFSEAIRLNISGGKLRCYCLNEIYESHQFSN